MVGFSRSVAGLSGVAAPGRVACERGAGASRRVKTGRNAAHSRRGPMSPAEAGPRVRESIGDNRMSRTGRRRRPRRRASLEFRKLRAEAGIAERQLREMRLRMTYETIKVGVGVLIAVNATIAMFKTIGLFF